MPFNLLKTYNALLDFAGMNPVQRQGSLKSIFMRDIACNQNFYYQNKQLHPTPCADGLIKMDLLFDHLTTVITDQATRKREFDMHRSVRLHWIKYHIEQNKKENMLFFSVKEKEGIRTYLYDIDEKYVIVLEPLRNGTSYYLLTAYHLTGKDAQRDKMMKKYKRKLAEVL